VIEQAGLSRRLGVSRAEPDRRAASHRRALHDDEPGALQRLHEPPRDDASHHLASVIHPLAPAVAQREGDGLGDVVGLRGRQLVGVGHAGRLAAEMERSKNGLGGRLSTLGERTELRDSNPCVSHLLLRKLSEIRIHNSEVVLTLNPSLVSGAQCGDIGRATFSDAFGENLLASQKSPCPYAQKIVTDGTSSSAVALDKGMNPIQPPQPICRQLVSDSRNQFS